MDELAREAWAAERRRVEQSRRWVSPAGRRPQWRSGVFSIAMQACSWGVWLAGIQSRGRRNALAPKLVEFDLAFATLPAAFHGYRILQLSDTHLDALPELAAVAADILAETEIDLLVHTGDVLTVPGTPVSGATAPLARVLSGVKVRDRRLAVLGNHDPPEMVEALESLGFHVLVNRSIALERDGERVQVIGLDDVHSFYTEAARAALFENSAAFRIALVHSAEMADHAGDAGVALYLCGHTHGGQICLPGGRPLVTSLTRCRHAARGLWHSGPTTGYTNCGLGINGPALRFNCAGEMTVITLRRAG
jgi:hypothetical protein